MTTTLWTNLDACVLTDSGIVSASPTIDGTTLVTSVITLDNDRVVTSTSLPDVQTPTVTSATGSGPDTTGVSIMSNPE